MARLLVPAFAFLSLAACGDDGGTGPAPNIDATLPNAQATCESAVTITGTFTPTVAADPTMGCSPAGGSDATGHATATWTTTVTAGPAGSNDDGLPQCQTVHINATYNYTVTEDFTSAAPGHTVQVTYGTPATGETDNFTISGDNGQCTANFDHVLANGSNWDEVTLHPQTQRFDDPGFNGTITGTGVYALWPPGVAP